MKKKKELALRKRPLYAATFIFLLSVLQIVALIGQFENGFRPFRHDPIRVPFSWDMFSNRVERCAVVWDPPLKGPSGPLASMRQLGTTMEWDVIYDHVENYRAMGLWLCQVGGPNNGSHVRMRCYLPEGKEIDDEFACH